MVSGGFTGGMVTISGLSAATGYVVEVAAVTSAGTGVFSDPVTFQTPDSKSIIQIISHIAYKHYKHLIVSLKKDHSHCIQS